MEDQRISDEEGMMIEHIKDQIHEFKTVSLTTLEEKMTEEQFRKILQSTIAEIISKTIEVAKKDNVISDDEIKILKTLIEFQDHIGKSKDPKSSFRI